MEVVGRGSMALFLGWVLLFLPTSLSPCPLFAINANLRFSLHLYRDDSQSLMVVQVQDRTL
jgi:hypothetical protein